MTRNTDPILDHPTTLAALYAAGAMTPDEQSRFESELNAGNTQYLAELKSFSPVLDSLLNDVTPAQPSPHVKADLMQRILKETGPAKPLRLGAIDPTIFMLRAADSPWLETGVDGVQVRILFVDHATNRQTILVRMAPGATYPSHHHHEPEECLVLQGDFESAGYTMHAGDYQRNPGGTVHNQTRTKNGCLLLVTSAAA